MSNVIPHRSGNEDPRPRLVVPEHDEDVWALAYLPDGRRVVTSSEDGTVKVWNLENGKQEGTSMEHGCEVVSLAVTRDGTKIISGGTNGSIKVWDVESHGRIREWVHRGGFPIAIPPDDQLVAVDRVSAIYTMEGRLVYSIELDNFKGVLWAAVSPDGKKLACSTDRGNIHVYDVKNGALILGPLKGHEGLVSRVLWSRDGSRLFSGSWDKTIRCWNFDTGEQIRQPWTGHTNWIRSLSLSPDGSILASASWDKTVRFWDAASGHPIGQHLQHDHLVFAIGFSPSGEFVASAGHNGNLYVWRAPRLNSIENLVTTSSMCFDTKSLPKVEGQSQRMSTFAYVNLLLYIVTLQSTSTSNECPPPPDLTPDIVRIKNQYSAGGSFGDVYRCRYHGGPVQMEV